MASKSQKTVAFEEVFEQLSAGASMPNELQEIFREEADDHLRTIYDGLNRLQSDNSDMAALADVRRASHTLKGAAGAVNLQAATRLAHRMEDLLDLLAKRKHRMTEQQLRLLLTTADQLQDLTTGGYDVQAVAEQVVELYHNYSIELGVAEQPSNNATRTARSESSQSNNAGEVSDTANASEVLGSPTQYLRVPLNRLDELVSLLGEMIVNRSEFQQRLGDFESRIEDMQSAMERLRNVANCVESEHNSRRSRSQQQSAIDRYYGNFDSPLPGGNGQTGRWEEFDQLEFEQFTDFHLLEQTLSEADNDAEIMSGEFRSVKTAFDSLLRRQQQLNREAQKSLMRIRMVPLAGIVSRLERTVRTVSKKLGRQVQLEVVGERIELDKTVLDEITDPLLHLIRNAIDHGVEDARVRADAGKPETACLRIKAVNQGTQVTLRISDDGAGINLEKVREKALQQGLIGGDQKLSKDEIHALIFLPGFSTASELTDVSGRGVGMDVVSEAIRRLEGTVRVDSEPGIGTTFTIQLPTTLGVARALLVESCGRTFAIPMQSIQQIQRLDPYSVSKEDHQTTTFIGDRNLRLIDLAAHLQLISEEENSSIEGTVPMLTLGDGDDEVAVTVDTILGSQDIVVKTLGDHLKKVRGLIGATISGDGSVIPILDTTDLVARQQTDLLAGTGHQTPSSPRVRRNVAMVVDDSISVRRVTENLLKLAGWDVVTAQDGVDALEKLADLVTPPDVFLCDLEMPRMDGLELVRQIREQQEFEWTPIVMITSRGSEKHRHKAFETGATDYVVKPYNDEGLLELITRLVQSAREMITA